MRVWSNIFWLGTKELRSVFSDYAMLALIVWAFSFSIYIRSNSIGETINNATIAFVDEDRSALSAHLRNALYPPYFKLPELIEAHEVDEALNQNRFMFVVEVPPRFEADIRQGRNPVLKLNIDATAIMQASLGAGYINNILAAEVQHFLKRSDEVTALPVKLVMRRAFNPNDEKIWFTSIVALLDQISILTIVLTGAALLREREHGTIQHLMVMPLTPFEIAVAKVWANGLIILVAFMLSLFIVVEGLLDVHIAGSKFLLLMGTVIYLFAAAAIGIFLATIARSMAQFALLMMMTILPMMMLSGGMSPIESQPEIIQPFTWLLPSRHYIAFAQAVAFRGAGLDIVWPQVVIVSGLGLAFFGGSLALFRRSLEVAE